MLESWRRILYILQWIKLSDICTCSTCSNECIYLGTVHEKDWVAIFVHEDEFFGTGSGIIINPVDQISIRVYHRETFTTNQKRFSPYCECRTRVSGLYGGGDGHYWFRRRQRVIAVDRPWPMLQEREHVQFFGVLSFTILRVFRSNKFSTQIW